MSIRATKRITVYKVVPSEGSLFSSGIGFDHEGNPVEFIGKTNEMKNIKLALDDFEDGDADGRPTIHLHPWQWEDRQ